MLISELIANLEKIKELEGDIEVVDGEIVIHGKYKTEVFKMKENLQSKDYDTVLVPFWAIDLLKYIKQKLSADKVTVLQSRDEMKYLIDCICNASITNKQAVDIYQKLNKNLKQITITTKC